MKDAKDVEKEIGPVVFIVEPVVGETNSPWTHEPMTEKEVAESLVGFEKFETIGPVDELMPDLGERGFGAFKYHPLTGRLTQEKAIIDIRLGDNGSERDMQSLLHWIQYKGTGRIEEHIATLGIDPAANVLTLNVKDKITIRMPLILVKAMISEHQELERIRLGKMG
jgi:hypothetical protein